VTNFHEVLRRGVRNFLVGRTALAMLALGHKNVLCKL